MNKPKQHFPNQNLRNGKYWLLTGATGLVGRYLMRDMLLAGAKLAVIVRPNKRMNARQRVESILQMWEQQLGCFLPRPVVIEGDVGQPVLGLDSDQLEWISANCDNIIHNAAILQFQGSDRAQEPWRTNLGGTQNVLELIRQTGIENLFYVSTAYVCGHRTGTVYENDFECGQEFRNDYEQSKFDAEQAVRNADFLKNTTIFRPAVIVGDSKTGYTSTYHGLYLYLRLLDTIIPMQEQDENGVFQTRIKLPLTGDEPRNLIAVDWVSEVITHLLATPESHNDTIHLVPDKFITARSLIDACYKYYNSAGVEYCGPNVKREALNDFSRMFFDNAKIYEQYETDDPTFDKSNLKKYAGHIPCPDIDDQSIFRFIDYGKSDKWGKRREKPANVKYDVAEHLDKLVLVAESCKQSSGDQLSIAFDFLGPGGGQWTLIGEDKHYRIQAGLCASADRLVCIHPDQFVPFLEKEGESKPWIDAFQNFINPGFSSVTAAGQ